MSNAETGAKPADGAATLLGFWSAILSAAFGILYVVAEAAHMAGMLGPQNSPASLVARMTPSLLLPITFVILAAAVHANAPGGRRIWTQIALIFAGVYAVLVSIVYFVQLTVVAPLMAQGRLDEVALLKFEHGSFLFAVDILGYAFMSLATLFAAPAFPDRGLERWIRLALTINGLLAPVIALQIYFAPLFYAAAVWLISFPAATVLLALWFRKSRLAAA